MRRVLLAVLAVGLVGAAGCSGDPPATPLSDSAAHQLQADVLTVTSKAAAEDWTGARAGLAKLRTDLATARSAGTLTPARAAAIEAAVAAVSSDLATAVAASTPPATPVATPTTQPKPTPQPKPTKSKHGKDGGDGG